MKKLGSLTLTLFICFLSLSISLSFANEDTLKVKSYLSTRNLELGDVLTYTIELSSKEKMPRFSQDFKPPQIEGLQFENSSQGSSTSMNFINGSMSRSFSIKLNLTYIAEKVGIYTIPSVSLDSAGALKTKPIKFRVYKQLPANLRSQQMQRSARSGSIMDQFFGNVRPSRSEDSRPLEFFVEAELDKEEVYKGEQLLVSWYIYISPGASVGSFDTLKFPTLKGFWKEDVNFATRFYFKEVERDGKVYLRSLMNSYALTPYKEGDHVIDPFELRTVLSSGFFNQKRKSISAKSDSILIKVKPLPKPAPETFLGGVGQFRVDLVKSPKTKVLYKDEPLEVSFRVVGDAATTKFLKAPKLDVGDAFHVYKVKDEYTFIPSKISSYKIFKYSLIPKKEGVYRLPDMRLSFLDSETQTYYDKYVQLPTYKVQLNPNTSQVSDEVYNNDDLTAKESEKEKVFVFTKRSWSFQAYLTEAVYARLSIIWTVFLIGLSFLLSIIVYIKFSRGEHEQQNLALELEERIQKAADLLKENKRNHALSELLNVLSLLVGAVNGKRFGAEKEIEQAVKSLPSSLKSSGERLTDLNTRLQELRFGTSLESYTNKAKLEKCLKDFQDLFSEFRQYLH